MGTIFSMIHLSLQSCSHTEDLKSTGSFYTWCNMRQGSQRQYCKLDRVLVNSGWIQSSLIAEAQFGNFDVSDHTPCVVSIKSDVSPVHRPFKFCDAWLQHPDFFHIVREAWSLEVHGCHMYRLVQRLKQVKQKLRRLHRGNFSNIDSRVQQIQEDLAVIHGRIINEPYNIELQQRDRELRDEYKRLQQSQIMILKQRAKVQWSQQVDLNSQYFHAQLKARRSQSTISSICNGQGERLTDDKLIREEILSFYQELLGSSSSAMPIGETILQNGPRVSLEQGEKLMSPVSETEIKSALFSIGNEKAPGPEGFLRDSTRLAGIL